MNEQVIIHEVTGTTALAASCAAATSDTSAADRTKRATGPITLAFALDLLGGYVGWLETPRGTKVKVDLNAYRGRSLENTLLRIRIKYVDPKLVGTKRAISSR